MTIINYCLESISSVSCKTPIKWKVTDLILSRLTTGLSAQFNPYQQTEEKSLVSTNSQLGPLVQIVPHPGSYPLADLCYVSFPLSLSLSPHFLFLSDYPID